jgi:hypothetical protein
VRISTWSFFASRPGTPGSEACLGKTAIARTTDIEGMSFITASSSIGFG